MNPATGRLLSIAAGALALLSPFLPLVNVMGQSVNIFGTQTGVGIFFIILAALVALPAFLRQRWAVIASVVAGVILLGLGIKYFADASSTAYGVSVSPGISVWLIIAAGLLGIIGGALQLRTPVVASGTGTSGNMGSGFGSGPTSGAGGGSSTTNTNL